MGVRGGGLQCLLGPGGGGRCLGSLRTILQRQRGWNRVYHESSVVSACLHLDCSTHVGAAWGGVEPEEEGGVEVAEGEKREYRCVFLKSSCRDDGGSLPYPAGGQMRSFQLLLLFGSLATSFPHTVEGAWVLHAWRYFA